MVQAGLGHSFSEAALLYELFFEVVELTFEEIVADFDQAENHIGTNFRVFVFNAFSEGFIISVCRSINLAQAFCAGVLR